MPGASLSASTTKIEKCIGGTGSINLRCLFKYDELQINVRQQSDNPYRNILSRIRLRIATDSDTAVLNMIKIQFTEAICDDRLYENYVIIWKKLRLEGVCLLLTYALCDTLNIAMLNRISSDEVELIAQDINRLCIIF